MALPRDKKERELFELRARVSQLESELSVVAGTLGDDECYDGDIAPGPMDIQMEEELVMEQEILIPQDYNESVDASVTSVEGDGGMDAQPTPSKKRIGYLINDYYTYLMLGPTPTLCPTPSLYPSHPTQTISLLYLWTKVPLSERTQEAQQYPQAHRGEGSHKVSTPLIVTADTYT